MAQSNELSDREREVVNLLLEGKSNKLIASSLHISESTVEFHLKNIYAKYQVSSRTELIINLRESTGAGNLRDSTVEVQGDIAENRDRSKSDEATASGKSVSKISKDLEMENLLDTNIRSDGNTTTFFEAIRVCLSKYADFQGTASRPEFWWFTLFVILVASALVYLSKTLGSVFLIAMLLPLLAAGTRRLRDSGKSPWWQLFLLAPVGGMVLVGILWALPPANPLPDETLQAEK